MNILTEVVKSGGAWDVRGEQRMWMCVLLQGIAEQDERFLTSIGKMSKSQAAAEAKSWLASEEFTECCGLAGVDPKFARRMSPERAHRVLGVIRGTSNDAEILRALQEQDDARQVAGE